ncbi:protein of unknown function [Bradyrhizobium sp. ORS 285]|nr:hypothetical protein BRAO285_2960002 [Bradyrhizobium sp. ORS 285]SMX59904.1 protein of unknown function [Bradyrhizobium sp. ORS 285]
MKLLDLATRPLPVGTSVILGLVSPARPNLARPNSARQKARAPMLYDANDLDGRHEPGMPAVEQTAQ